MMLYRPLIQFWSTVVVSPIKKIREVTGRHSRQQHSLTMGKSRLINLVAFCSEPTA